MRQLLILTAVFVVLPSVCHGQSDLQKIGNFLQELQEYQEEQQGGGTTLPYNASPNASGNQNNGNFNGQGFFQPSNQQQFPQQGQPYPQGGVVYPQGQLYPNNGVQQQYPNQNIIYQSQPPVRKVYSNQPIKIRCDSDVTGACSYELITAKNTVYPYSISGGQSQNLVENTDWALRYRPTPSSPYKTYRLRGGKTYERRKAGNIWQCYMLQ